LMRGGKRGVERLGVDALGVGHQWLVTEKVWVKMICLQ